MTSWVLSEMRTAKSYLIERLLSGLTLDSQTETARLIGTIEGLSFIERLEEEVRVEQKA